MHPNFPKRPMSAFQIFCRKEGVNTLVTTENDKLLLKNFKNEKNPKVVESRREAAQERKNYLNNLKDFVRENSDSLFHKQIESVNRKIKRLERSEEPKAKGDASKQKKLTAFEFFMNSKKHKVYTLVTIGIANFLILVHRFGSCKARRETQAALRQTGR